MLTLIINILFIALLVLLVRAFLAGAKKVFDYFGV